ncbi:Uncharacterised protein [Vibrio cholerae]|nr:Uncharacterised protein [Vibrio cholerae]
MKMTRRAFVKANAAASAAAGPRICHQLDR